MRRRIGGARYAGPMAQTPDAIDVASASGARTRDRSAPRPVEQADAGARLLGPGDVRGLATALGIRPTRLLGQNFVQDPGTVRRIVHSAGVLFGESVLEVGPGLGSLTLALLETGARVTAVEVDPVLARALPVTVADRAPGAVGRLRVVLADALTIDAPAALGMPENAPAPTRLVANLPYNIAVPVLLTLFAALPDLGSATVMVQAEVADRLTAVPGSRTYGVPSVKTAWYAAARRTITIGRTVFWPAPNVDSALVELSRRRPPATSASRSQVFAVVDAAFAQRRKTLRKALAPLAGGPRAAEDAARAAGIDPSLRGEKLDVAAFAALAETLAATGSLPAPTAQENR